jgi:hypothetical protein
MTDKDLNVDPPEARAASAQDGGPADEAERAVKTNPSRRGASAKDSALGRLREAPDEELALFEDSLRQSALAAGATERELREAQSGHPGHS